VGFLAALRIAASMTFADCSLVQDFLSAPAKGMHKTDKPSIIEDINLFIFSLSSFLSST